MRISVLNSAFLAVLVGFGGSLAVVLEAAKSTTASADQVISWVALLCLSVSLTTVFLSHSAKIPIVTAWSTPGAAAIGTFSGIDINIAVGAFFACGLMMIITSLVNPIARQLERIPGPIIGAMLAGVLFPFVTAIVHHSATTPHLALPILLAFLLTRERWPSLSVLVAILAGIFAVLAFWPASFDNEYRATSVSIIVPQFDLNAFLNLAIPLYLVTMSGQNLAGYGVLTNDGYSPPTRKILATTGIGSTVTAFFGAHTTSLAAITAALCTGSDTHPDPKKRFQVGYWYGGGYLVLAVFAGPIIAFASSLPPALVPSIASVALLPTFMSSLSSMIKDELEYLFPATVTFAVTASTVSLWGLGSPLLGLVIGVGIVGLRKFGTRR